MSEATELRYEPLVDRQSTFAVWVGHPNAGSVLIGYLRLDDQVRWVARTLGSASQAADIRRFRDRYAASVWLQKAVDGVHPRPRRVAG
jgi:hypothetical protein